MRGKMKIWKSTSLLTIIASLILVTSLIRPSLAGMTTLTAPEVTDDTKGPCSEVWINIAVTDAVNLWGFMFTLKYDTSVLTALDYTGHPIFYLEEPGEINTEEGYVSLAYHMGFGVPAGFTGSLTNLASIKFHVDAYGQSQLEIQDSVFSDPVGNPLAHVTEDGYFCNVPGAPIADFEWTPEEPIEKELVTFTSTSTDSDGYIVSCDWNFGDGGTGTGLTTTHKYMKKGTYTVTLTATDNDGKTDSFSKKITAFATPPKAVGAKLLTANCTSHSLNWSDYGGVEIIRLRASAKNLNNKEPTLVRLAFFVYDAAAMENLGAIETDWTWLKKGQSTQFRTDFDYSEWDFTGPEMEYLIIVHLYYMDYYIIDPTPENPEGQPHWVEVPEEKSFTFWVYELAPVMIFTWADIGDCTVYFDATASYDPDEWLGDYIVEYQWRVYAWWIYPYKQIFTPTASFKFEYAGECQPGTYYCRLYVTDTWGATVWTGFEVTVAG